MSSLCASCTLNPPTLTVRTRPLCPDCFIRYITSKVRKRMESYRVRNTSQDQHTKKRLFLPLSGGVSSLALLQVLDAQLTEQLEKQNWRVYEVVVAHVELSGMGEGGGVGEWYERVATRFGLHEYLPVVQLDEVFRVDVEIERDLAYLGLMRKRGEDDGVFLRSVLDASTSVTTRADLTALLMKRLLVALARQHGCDGILWGHSDSRLAAHALSEVAKGRGASVSQGLAEGQASAGGVASHHPMRDLFKSELELYASVLEPPLELLPDSSEEGPVTSIRNTSIDDLLSKYITSQGEKYPSIMANVVRTASKLQVPPYDAQSAFCTVCRCLLEEQGADQVICYGCVRMKQDIKGQG